MLSHFLLELDAGFQKSVRLMVCPLADMISVSGYWLGLKGWTQVSVVLPTCRTESLIQFSP